MRTQRTRGEPAAGRVEHLFIVRLWYEQGADDAAEWRGSAEHIPSKSRLYFSDLSALRDFVARNAIRRRAVEQQSEL
jgi:hypothetical protein